jgi:hypothetical protein
LTKLLSFEKAVNVFTVRKVGFPQFSMKHLYSVFDRSRNGFCKQTSTQVTPCDTRSLFEVSSKHGRCPESRCIANVTQTLCKEGNLLEVAGPGSWFYGSLFQLQKEHSQERCRNGHIFVFVCREKTFVYFWKAHKDGPQSTLGANALCGQTGRRPFCSTGALPSFQLANVPVPVAAQTVNISFSNVVYLRIFEFSDFSRNKPSLQTIEHHVFCCFARAKAAAGPKLFLLHSARSLTQPSVGTRVPRVTTWLCGSVKASFCAQTAQ